MARRHYEQVVEGLGRVADATVLGSGFDPASQMGPLVSSRHRDKVMGLIGGGRAEGAEIVAGGTALEREGYFVRPTVVANSACSDLTLVREEVFGPVVVAMPFDDPRRCWPRPTAANTASAPASGATTCARCSPVDGLHAGTVWVNTHNVVDPNLPFGGYKASGVGREHGRSAIDAYTELKSVCMAY